MLCLLFLPDNHGSGKWRYLKGNYYWRDPCFISMIMGGRVSMLCLWMKGCCYWFVLFKYLGNHLLNHFFTALTLFLFISERVEFLCFFGSGIGGRNFFLVHTSGGPPVKLGVMFLKPSANQPDKLSISAAHSIATKCDRTWYGKNNGELRISSQTGAKLSQSILQWRNTHRNDN